MQLLARDVLPRNASLCFAYRGSENVTDTIFNKSEVPVEVILHEQRAHDGSLLEA